MGKKGFLDVINETGKKVASVAEKAGNAVSKAIDKNNDGKIDLSDFKIIGNKIESDSLKPIFKDDILATDYSLPNIIRVAEIDKKRANAQTCKNSIGYKLEHKDVQIVTIYPKNIGLFEIELLPNSTSGVYHKNPFKENSYISLDEYYNYLRTAKSTELTEVAQLLGAKYFRICTIEDDNVYQHHNVKVNVNASVKLKGSISNDVEHEETSTKSRRIEIMGENHFVGGDPEEPNLVYLKGNPDIEGLIKMRMRKNPITHKTITIDLISSSGIRIKDAEKIDGALNALKLGVSCAIQGEAKKESHRKLQYEIDF